MIFPTLFRSLHDCKMSAWPNVEKTGGIKNSWTQYVDVTRDQFLFFGHSYSGRALQELHQSWIQVIRLWPPIGCGRHQGHVVGHWQMRWCGWCCDMIWGGWSWGSWNYSKTWRLQGTFDLDIVLAAKDRTWKAIIERLDTTGVVRWPVGFPLSFSHCRYVAPHPTKEGWCEPQMPVLLIRLADSEGFLPIHQQDLSCLKECQEQEDKVTQLRQHFIIHGDMKTFVYIYDDYTLYICIHHMYCTYIYIYMYVCCIHPYPQYVNE